MIGVIPFQLVPIVCPLHQLLGYSLTTADLQAISQANQYCDILHLLTQRIRSGVTFVTAIPAAPSSK